MTLPEIQGHLQELYGIDVSPNLISAVTDAVLENVAELAKPASTFISSQQFEDQHARQMVKSVA